MASYGYGPPPPAPPPAQAPSQGGYPNYSSPYQSSHHQGGHGNHQGQRGGRGGHQAPHYPYNGQPQGQQQYGQPQAGSYPPQGPPANYPPQQWQHDQSHAHHPQQPHQASQPNPQNYHPNYAPHVFQPQQPYGQQPPYQQPYGQPQYARPDAVPQQQQQWNGPQQQHGPQFGGGRGGRGGHHVDRGGAKMMGPPIRIGFEQNAHAPEAPAPVSGGYYGPQGTPAPYAAGPYQGYPPHGAPAPMPGPPQYDAFAHQNGRQHGRGGFHNNHSRGGRPHQFGGGADRNRHNNNFKKPGGHTPGPHSQSHQKPDAASAGKKKKRKTNTLGLTPGDESEEDDFDEEAKLLELIGPDAINPTDIAAWIAERRQNFPTKARIKAKQAQAANPEKSKPDGKDPAAAAAAAAALERQQQKAEKLRRQLEKVESSIKRKREQQDEGDEMRDVDAASPSISSNSDDEAPEALPTRFEPNPSLPPPPKKADPSKHCKYFSTGGTCGKKGKCRFVHDQSVREAALKERERNGGRMTLQQRLTLNDKDQEDLTIVKTLQYLKEKGTIGDTKPAGGDDASSQSTSKSQLPPPPVRTEGHPSLPPHPPPSVVSNSQTARYQGWNLSGFGNTGVKSGDL